MRQPSPAEFTALEVAMIVEDGWRGIDYPDDPFRPRGWWGFKRRVRFAWAVFCGQADIVWWMGVPRPPNRRAEFARRCNEAARDRAAPAE